VLVSTAPLAAQPAAGAQLPSVQLPPELDRVLTDYEQAWQARDAAALAALFAPDGFVMAAGRPPTRGRAAIQEYYTGRGGPLSLRAIAFAAEGDLAYIIGGYASDPGMSDGGKFVLTLRKSADGRWLIVTDMDNPNQ
jgi:ketosteroid isomerase-like protein